VLNSYLPTNKQCYSISSNPRFCWLRGIRCNSNWSIHYLSYYIIHILSYYTLLGRFCRPTLYYLQSMAFRI